jgi:hypothetical protein
MALTSTKGTKTTMNSTLHSLKELPGGTRHVQKSAPNIRRQQREPSATSCRLAISLINHHTGTPFGSGTSPELEGFLPSERALLAVGLSGLRSSGEQFKRVAFYGYRDNQALLRYPADFDPITGAVKIKEGAKAPREAELAAMNWMQGILFGENVAAGTYDFCQRVQNEPLPLRREFAQERCVASSCDMFQTYMSLYSPVAKTTIPEIIPLITAAQLPPNDSPVGLPVSEFQMEPDCFRSHAVDRFVLGLSSTTGDGFAELKRAFIRQFTVADDAIGSLQSQEDGHTRLMQIASEITGVGSDQLVDGKHGLLEFVWRYISNLNLEEDRLKSASLISYQAVRLLQNYFLNRSETGQVIMYAPKDGGGELFKKPSLHTVVGSPLIIVDNFASNGRFPYNAADLIG